MSLLVVDTLGCRHGHRQVLDGVSFTLDAGEVLGIIGPNGAGKSSLLRVLAGLSPVHAGRVTLNGTDLHRQSAAARAKAIGYHPQQAVVHWPMTVASIVALGRYAHGASLDRLDHHDREAIAAAIHQCGLEALLERRADQLSGGELARVHIARLLAGEHRLLLADEPIANLDPRFQIEILKALRKHAHQRGAAIVVLHDLNIAARHCDRLLLLADGRKVIDGAPREVLTAARIAEVFAVTPEYFHDTGIAQALGL
ncbi:MAG: ABC transporter ATP-binding protein [Proteobacteria bacterium]|jgi:iron complex transport system ATP-binding protein|nr:ABC transporter ATP-binding protein [Pseudomonadota bacterium]